MAEKVGVTPATGLVSPSRRVIVTVEKSVPSATTGLDPVIVEVSAFGGPELNDTVVVSAPNPAGALKPRVFVPYAVETIDPVV